MTNLYIGNRLTHTNMNKALNSDSVMKLNEGMAKLLRSVALKKGINKTKKGARLEFYVVSEEEFKELTDPAMATLMGLKGDEWLPLIRVDSDIMSKLIDTNNAKHSLIIDAIEPPAVTSVATSYNMSDETRQIFADIREYNSKVNSANQARKDELVNLLVDAVTKIQDDTKVVRDKAEKKRNKNNIKVGDLVKDYNEYGLRKVTRVSAASYWYDELMPDGTIITRPEYAALYFEGVLVNGVPYEINDEYDSGRFTLTIPFKGNEDRFQAETVKKPTRWTGYEEVGGAYEVELDVNR